MYSNIETYSPLLYLSFITLVWVLPRKSQTYQSLCWKNILSLEGKHLPLHFSRFTKFIRNCTCSVHRAISEKQVQNLLIHLCNKAVRICAFCLCYLHAICPKPSVFTRANFLIQKFKPNSLLVENILKYSVFDLFKENLNTLKK